MPRIVAGRTLFAAPILGLWAVVAMGQGPVNRVVGPIDEAQVVTLTGNVHPLARGEYDEGAVNPETQLDNLMLELEPSAAQQAELDALVEAQHDPESPLYHQWLTPAEYGARFGASAEDVARVSEWLEEHGFRIEEVAASNRLIVFSGTAGGVFETFHTQMHRYVVNGASHLANAEDPRIPATLAGVVGGVVSLHDFRRQGAIASKKELSTRGARNAAGARPEDTNGGTHYLYPADWAKIYDLNSLYNAGTTGTGTSIAIVGRSDIVLTDVAAFRSSAGLAANPPAVTWATTDPGLVAGDQDESTLDVEWSGGIAPGATVKFVVGASAGVTDGVDISAQYIVNHAVAQVVSTSYGSCESEMGSTELAFYNSLWEQAAGEGMSAFVSSGDAGASGCDGGSATTGSGRAVNGLCSSTYSTCVGGTEFNEGSSSSTYWSATNGAGNESAQGYIPEEVWNESGANGGSGLWSSGGGASLVYSQPSWQQGVSGTSAANGMRAVPDVAASAAGHDGYIIVESDSYWVISGTSAASPSIAGVMALLVQSKGGTGQGNANPGLYALTKAIDNPFHPTPSGNNSVPGVTGFAASGATYNLATGLGSVDGAVLVSAWAGGSNTVSRDFTLTPSATDGTVLVGKSTTFSVGATESGAGKNTIALKGTAPAGVTVGISPESILPGATATVTITVGSTAAAGTQNITISGTDSTGTTSVTYALTVTPLPTLTLTAASKSMAVTLGASGTMSLTATTGGSYSGNIGFSVSGLPTGVSAGWSANPVTGASGVSSNNETLTLSALSTATVGSATITVTAAGDSLTSSQTVTLEVEQAAGVTLTATPGTVSVQSLATTMVTVTATPTGGATIPAAASGSSIGVASGLPKGFTATWSAAALTSSGAAVWTLTLTGSASAAAATSTLGLTAKVVAKSGTTYTVSANVPMTVTLTPPALTVSLGLNPVSIMQGSTATETVGLTGNGTFSGLATLTTSGLPTGVTASWSGNPVTLSAANALESGSATLTLTASPTATLGTATVTVTASGDGVTATKQFSLQVGQAPGVTLAASPTSVSVQSLATATVTVTGTPVGGVAIPAGASGSSINVASGLPKGFAAIWSAPSVNSAGTVSWTLTLTGSSTAVAGTATLGLTAKVAAKGGTTYTASVNLPMTVTLSQPALTVTPASISVSVSQGAQTSDVISLAGNAVYNGSVTMSVSGLPSGVTASWSGNPVTLTAEAGKTTLTLTASGSSTAGSTPITVAAAGDGVTASQKLTLTVLAAAPTLTVTPASSSMNVINPMEAIIAAQTVASQAISFTGGGSFHGAVSLNVSGLPSNLTASWSSNPVTLNSANSGSSTLTITAGATSQNGVETTVAPGAYSITVIAAGDGLTVTKSIQVEVEGVAATPSATTLTIHRGTTGSFSIAATTAGGASGILEPGLAANASTSGITVSANPSSVSAPAGGTITFTFTVSSSAALTSYQLVPAAALLSSPASTAPILIGRSTAPVTLNIVQ